MVRGAQQLAGASVQGGWQASGAVVREAYIPSYGATYGADTYGAGTYGGSATTGSTAMGGGVVR